MMAALAVVLGYLFIFIPNIEPVTATLFIAGVMLGPRLGLMTALVAELIYSLFNPMGMAPLPILAAQLISMSLVGLAGGFLHTKPGLIQKRTFFIWSGAIGFVLTLIFDVSTTLSFAWFSAGASGEKILSQFFAGTLFYSSHILGNTAIFIFVVPLLLRRISPFHPDKSRVCGER